MSSDEALPLDGGTGEMGVMGGLDRLSPGNFLRITSNSNTRTLEHAQISQDLSGCQPIPPITPFTPFNPKKTQAVGTYRPFCLN